MQVNKSASRIGGAERGTGGRGAGCRGSWAGSPWQAADAAAAPLAITWRRLLPSMSPGRALLSPSLLLALAAALGATRRRLALGAAHCGAERGGATIGQGRDTDPPRPFCSLDYPPIQGRVRALRQFSTALNPTSLWLWPRYDRRGGIVYRSIHPNMPPSGHACLWVRPRRGRRAAPTGVRRQPWHRPPSPGTASGQSPWPPARCKLWQTRQGGCCA